MIIVGDAVSTTAEVALKIFVFLGGCALVFQGCFFSDAATEVVLKRVLFLGSCAAVVRGFFFGAASLFRVTRFLS